MAGYNQEFCSRLIANGFAFSFGQHKSVERALALGSRLIGQEIQYIRLFTAVPIYDFHTSTIIIPS